MSNIFLHFNDFCAFSRKFAASKWKTAFIRSMYSLVRDATRMIELLSLPLSVFAKSAACPPADNLLSFSKSLLSTEQNRSIAAHLEDCDFCRAELQLLERFPGTSEAIAVGEMPRTLRVLAESILGNPHRLSRSLGSPRALSH